MDTTTFRYDFSGNVIASREVYNHHATGTSPYIVYKEYVYDHANRLTESYHQVGDSGPLVLLNQSRYNEIGELIEKNLHGDDPQNPSISSYLQSIDYRYNIRGWLQYINTATTLEDPDLNPDQNALLPDHFGAEFLYTDSSLTE